jgi:hypothetical protein
MQETINNQTFKIAIIGGGPLCTYALERLAALLPKKIFAGRLHIVVFERTGRFGAGEVHSDIQVRTSYMNRIAGQIALAADESMLESSKLLPKYLRPTFLEWCQKTYSETGDQRFNLLARDIPKRYIHGLALRNMFQVYVTILRNVDNINVDLHDSSVIDVSYHPDAKRPFKIYSDRSPALTITANHILFVTGHSVNNSKVNFSALNQQNSFQFIPQTNYVSCVYPLENKLKAETVPKGCIVGVEGLGLTAIDTFLHLTEGRGGQFVPNGNQSGSFTRLKYIYSGQEPSLIVGFSPSGYFTTCRPDNAKEGNTALEHKGVFFTTDIVKKLRHSLGTSVTLCDGQEKLQLDFEKHVFPLVILEMAYVYYKTLLGQSFGDHIFNITQSRVESFIQNGCSSCLTGIEYLLEPAQSFFDEAANYINQIMSGKSCLDCQPQFESMKILNTYLLTVFNLTIDSDKINHSQVAVDFTSLESPYGYSTKVYSHKFSWQQIFEPFSLKNTVSIEEWEKMTIAYLQQDIMHAIQNNLENPIKAACDCVWRDLRNVFSEVADCGGLLSESHKIFMTKYLRYYNRLSNGAGIEAMKKVLALLDCGLLSIGIGPSSKIVLQQGCKPFCIVGTKTGAKVEVEVLINARVHPFDPEQDAYPLYPNLLRRQLIRKFCNPGQSPAEKFYPGGLDLSDAFHPIQNDGSINKDLTFIGLPTDGVRFFQASIARPYSNSYILKNISNWADELVENLS